MVNIPALYLANLDSVSSILTGASQKVIILLLLTPVNDTPHWSPWGALTVIKDKTAQG